MFPEFSCRIARMRWRCFSVAGHGIISGAGVLMPDILSSPFPLVIARFLWD